MRKTVINLALLLLGVIVGFSIFTATGTVSLYRSMKRLQAEEYLSEVSVYSYWQYKQAGPTDAETALAGYLRAIEWLRTKHVHSMEPRLAFEAGLANLRLYRLANLAGKRSAADEYMRNAQAEFTKRGLTHVSSAHLAELIETRELKELELLKQAGVRSVDSSNHWSEEHKR